MSGWGGEALRIAHVCQAVFPEVVGGAPLVVHQLASGQAARGHDVQVHTVSYGGSSLAPRDYKVVRHPYKRMPWDRIGTAGNPLAPALRHAVAASGADVVHLHSHLFFATWFGQQGARDAGIPNLVTVHGVRAARSLAVNALQEMWMQTMARRVFHRADAITCLTQADLSEAAGYVKRHQRSKIHLVPNSYDEALFRANGEPRQALVAWVGRQVPEKGLPDLVEAWALLEPSHPGWRLCIVGDGPVRPEVERLVQQRRLEQVELRGMASQEEVAELLRRTSVFCFPSIREGLSVALLEAMASGCAIVTTEGNASVVGNAGLVVPPRDPVSLCASLGRLMDDDGLRTTLGALAAARARAKFGMANVMDQYERIYQTIIREATSPSGSRSRGTASAGP